MLSHYILLILIYRYNVSTDIKCCNGINYYHYELELINCIQIRIQQLCNVIIFNNHINSPMIQADPTFISASIDLLHYSLDYAAKGTPSNDLKSDIQSIAKRMSVACSPLPIAYRDEK